MTIVILLIDEDVPLTLEAQITDEENFSDETDQTFNFQPSIRSRSPRKFPTLN